MPTHFVRVVFCRYSHPKQVLVRDGMLSPDMVAYCAANSRATRRALGAAGWCGGVVHGAAPGGMMAVCLVRKA